MNPVVLPNTAQLDLLNTMSAALAPWDGAKVHLYKAPVAIGPGMVLADFTAVAADFTGYTASAAVVWAAAFYQEDGTPVLTADLKTFTVGSPVVTTNTVYGYYLTDSAGTTLLWARQFDAPVVMGIAGQSLEVIPSNPAYLSS